MISYGIWLREDLIVRPSLALWFLYLFETVIAGDEC